jgi:hypothetical protein
MNKDYRQSTSNIRRKSSKRLKPDSCQTHQYKPDRLTPYSWQPAPPDHIIGATTASFAFLASRAATVRTSFQLCLVARTGHSSSQEWRTLAIALGVNGLLIYSMFRAQSYLWKQATLLQCHWWNLSVSKMTELNNSQVFKLKTVN